MISTKKQRLFWSMMILLSRLSPVAAQLPVKVLTLPEALRIAAANYQLLQAKENYAKASAEAIHTAKKDALPDFTLSAENAFGTLNGMNCLSSGQPGITAKCPLQIGSHDYFRAGGQQGSSPTPLFHTPSQLSGSPNNPNESRMGRSYASYGCAASGSPTSSSKRVR